MSRKKGKRRGEKRSAGDSVRSQSAPSAARANSPVERSKSGAKSRPRRAVAVIVLLLAVALAWLVLRNRTSEDTTVISVAPDVPPTAQIPRIEDLADLDPGMRQATESAISSLQPDLGNGERWGELGMVYHAHQYFELAREAYEQALQLDTTDARWSYYLAVLALDRGQRDRALELLERSLTNDGSLVVARLRLVGLLIDQGEFTRAAGELDALSRNDPGEPAIFRLRGRLALEQGRSDEARATLEKARAALPDDRETRYLLAQALRDTGDRQGASELLADIEQLSDATFPDPLMSAVNTRRRDLMVVVNSANLALQQGRIDDAIRLFETVLEQDPAHFDAHHNLGLIAGRQGRLDDAERHMRDALLAEPQRPEPLWGLAMVTAQTGRESEAITHLELLLERNPGHQRAAGLLAEIRARLGQQ